MSARNICLSLLLTSTSPVVTEIFAPAMRDALPALGMWVEGSVALYFGVMALVHLLHGAATARFGVDAIAAYGCVVFGAACASLATNDVALPFPVARGVQAVGASACMVAGFARVRTHLRPRRHLPLLNSARALLLVLTPMVGQAVTSAYGWRATFAVVAALPVLSVVLLLLPRTPPRTSDTEPMMIRTTTNARTFAAWVLADAFGFASMLLWVAYAPFLAPEDDGAFGYWYGLTFLGSVFGPLCARSSKPRGVFALASLAGTVSAGVALAYADDARVLYTGMTGFTFARALAATHAQAEALRTAPSAAHGAGLLHSVRMVVAAATIGMAEATGATAALMLACGALGTTIIFL